MKQGSPSYLKKVNQMIKIDVNDQGLFININGYEQQISSDQIDEVLTGYFYVCEDPTQNHFSITDQERKEFNNRVVHLKDTYPEYFV